MHYRRLFVPKKKLNFPQFLPHVIHTLAKTMMKLNPMWNLHSSISKDENGAPLTILAQYSLLLI